MKRRIKAIACALWFGILPWQCYELECHYKGMSYLNHLLLNLGLALKWMLFLESRSDIEFEKKINGN
jgi:hypothetical protein